MFFRINYELSKRLGVIERKHKPGKLSAEDVIGSLNLENPALADVRKAYGSQGCDYAVVGSIERR